MGDFKEVMEAKIECFNEANPPGTQVAVVKDDGTRTVDIIKYEASIMGGHTAVAWLKSLGSYSLDRVFTMRKHY